MKVTAHFQKCLHPEALIHSAYIQFYSLLASIHSQRSNDLRSLYVCGAEDGK